MRADTLRTHLGIAMGYMGRQSSVRQIHGATLSAFRQHLLGRIAAKDFADTYARDVFASFKYFVRWLANNTDKLENLPKNIDDRQMRISVTPRKAKTLTTEQIKTLLANANQRTRLYLLLGLNCGMTQIDMSDLHPGEVDWEHRVITRKRSKTQDCENVPVVSYPLWPDTFTVLKDERSDDPDHVLLTRDGRPLRTDIIEGEKFKKTDPVRLAINRLAKKAEITFTLKALKKTSASLLRGNRDYQGLESLFLDHSPGSVAHRHYTTIPQELLNEAIEWLGRELGIVAEVRNID